MKLMNKFQIFMKLYKFSFLNYRDICREASLCLRRLIVRIIRAIDEKKMIKNNCEVAGTIKIGLNKFEMNYLRFC